MGDHGIGKKTYHCCESEEARVFARYERGAKDPGFKQIEEKYIADLEESLQNGAV